MISQGKLPSDEQSELMLTQGAVSIRKTVLLGMVIPMLKIRRPTGRLIFNMGITIPGKTVFYIETGPRSLPPYGFTRPQWVNAYFCDVRIWGGCPTIRWDKFPSVCWYIFVMSFMSSLHPIGLYYRKNKNLLITKKPTVCRSPHLFLIASLITVRVICLVRDMIRVEWWYPEVNFEFVWWLQISWHQIGFRPSAAIIKTKNFRWFPLLKAPLPSSDLLMNPRRPSKFNCCIENSWNHSSEVASQSENCQTCPPSTCTTARGPSGWNLLGWTKLNCIRHWNDEDTS